MSGFNPDIVQHHLNISSKARSMKQKHHKFALDRQQTINEEIDKLLRVGFIIKVQHP